MRYNPATAPYVYPAPATQQDLDARCRRAVASTVIDGGVTINPFTGQEPLLGYVVAKYRNNSEHSMQVSHTSLCTAVVRHYVDINEPTLKEPRAYLGLWHNTDDDMVYLDIVSVYEKLGDALAEARRLDQKAIYCLHSQEELAVEPTLKLEGGMVEGSPDWFGESQR